MTCWLVIPYFSGAAYVYEHYVRPFFLNPHTINIWYVPRKKDVFSKPDDVLTAAEKYIEENGTEAFEKLIHRVCMSIDITKYFLLCIPIKYLWCIQLLTNATLQELMWFFLFCSLTSPKGVEDTSLMKIISTIEARIRNMFSMSCSSVLAVPFMADA